MYKSQEALDLYRDLDEFTRGYIDAALWSSSEDDGTPLDERFRARDIHPDSLRQAVEDCREFQEVNEILLRGCYNFGQDYTLARGTRKYRPSNAGHDFWLTRNGHGAGFWDRGLGDYGEPLTDASDRAGNVDLYVGDDGCLHLSP